MEEGPQRWQLRVGHLDRPGRSWQGPRPQHTLPPLSQLCPQDGWSPALLGRGGGAGQGAGKGEEAGLQLVPALGASAGGSIQGGLAHETCGLCSSEAAPQSEAPHLVGSEDGRWERRRWVPRRARKGPRSGAALPDPAPPTPGLGGPSLHVSHTQAVTKPGDFLAAMPVSPASAPTAQPWLGPQPLPTGGSSPISGPPASPRQSQGPL